MLADENCKISCISSSYVQAQYIYIYIYIYIMRNIYIYIYILLYNNAGQRELQDLVHIVELRAGARKNI